MNTKGYPYRKRWKRLQRRIIRAVRQKQFNPHSPLYWDLINRLALLEKHRKAAL